MDKGSSINDVTPEGEGGGIPQKVTRGDRGRYPVLTRGDVTPMTFNFKITTVLKLIKDPPKLESLIVIWDS